jgi:aldehyde dehydrogenase (NAD+)
MKEALQFYINGEWVDPVTPKTMDVIDPSTEEAIGRISLGSAADVDRAVAAAQAAFESFSQTSREERAELLGRIVAGYKARIGEMAETISAEMGAPAARSPRPPPKPRSSARRDRRASPSARSSARSSTTRSRP